MIGRDMIDFNSLLSKSIEILKKTAELPDKGYLAGGALATTSWNLIYGTDVPINDIDIFLFTPQEQGGKIIKEETSASVEESSYSGVCVTINSRVIYKICDVTQEGIINFVKYTSNTDTISGLISRFDLNSTQVGYNLETGEFYWTKEFEEFLLNKKLFVCEIVTPVKTLSRLYKKAQEFSIGFDQCEADILNLSINFGSDKVNKQNLDRFRKYVPNINDYSFNTIHVNNPFSGSKKYSNNLFSIKYKKILNSNTEVIRKNLFKYRLYKDVMDPIKFFSLLPILQDNPPIDQLNKEFIDSALSILDSFSTNLPHLLGKTYKEIESEFFQIKNKFGLAGVKYLWANTKPEKNLNKLSEIEYYLLHKR